MQWSPAIAIMVKHFNNGTLTDEERGELDDAGFFDDDSEMYPHDEAESLNPPWWEYR